jgi:hypothetical protein
VRHDRREDDPTLEYAAEELVAESVVFWAVGESSEAASRGSVSDSRYRCGGDPSLPELPGPERRRVLAFSGTSPASALREGDRRQMSDELEDGFLEADETFVEQSGEAAGRRRDVGRRETCPPSPTSFAPTRSISSTSAGYLQERPLRFVQARLA